VISDVGTPDLARWRDARLAEAEVTRLRAENSRLKLEKEILKKAAAYFAKEST
jgi:transposase-like protein